MTANRSAEELAMRDAVEAWGRKRWRSARVVHELVISQCRIDMAFISRDHIAGVEIKSSRDTLDRLDQQYETFRKHLPEVWIAIAPKWVDPLREMHLSTTWRADRIVVEVDREPPLPKVMTRWGDRALRIDRSITSAMLHMLWRGELAAIASRKRLDYGKRSTIGYLVPLIARKLTGDEIVIEVCRELRARDAFWKADPPIYTNADFTLTALSQTPSATDSQIPSPKAITDQ